jgi:hypothetical protein
VSSTEEHSLQLCLESHLELLCSSALLLTGFAQGQRLDIDTWEADAMFRQFEEGSYANICPTLAQSGMFDTPTQGSCKPFAVHPACGG